MAFVLGPAAVADLQKIARYTQREWGRHQASRYRIQLEQCMGALADGKLGYKDLSEIASGLRMMRCQHHFIVGRIRNEAPFAIYAILHERMDLVARIADRLT